MASAACSSSASSSHAVLPSEKLEQDMKALKDGIWMLFTNEFQQAEDAFRQGASQDRFRPPAEYKGVVRDSRGTFALVYAIVSFMFGLLSFANDQLDECLSRVWAAESLLLEDAPWVGQKMLLGMAYLIAGVVQAAKNAWLKSGVNLVRALRFISVFEEGLHFEGPEAPMVRSFSLFFLGLFNLVLSMLPPQMLKIASRAGGRSLHGSRSDALRLLTDCHEQDGIMAPFAVLVLLAYNISMKQQIGERFTEEDFEMSRELLQWASERFPGSAVFGFWQTELHTVRAEIQEARLVVDKVSDVLTKLNLPAVDSFLEQKKAMLSLALLDWENAAVGFERSLAVSVAKQRRSYVPLLSYLAGLCRTLCSDSEADPRAHENFNRVHQYSKMRKRNWPPEDDLAFIKVKEFGPKFSLDSQRALTEMAEIVMIKLSGLHTMPETSKRELQGILLPRVDDPIAEEAARALLISAELARLLEETEDAKRLALQGLDLAPKLGARGASNGTVATLHLVLAMLDVDGHMEAMEKCSKCCRAYDEALKFQRAGLARKIADAQQNGASESRRQSLGASSMAPDSTSLVDAEVEEADDDEFFSAEDEDKTLEEKTPSKSLSSWFRRREKPASLNNIDADEHTCAAPGSPSSSSAQFSLSWASDIAYKAFRDVAKKSAVVGGELRLKASEQLGPLLERPLAQATGLNSALGSSSRRRKTSGSSKLHLEALLKQANQGDCSIVEMSTPGPDAPETEVLAYLRWAHWNSLRGFSRFEALRQHGLLTRSPDRPKSAR